MRTEIRYGKRISELRQERGWTQEHLASVTGLDARTIQRVEKNVTRGQETLMAIASAFDLAIPELGRRYWIAESKPLSALTIQKSTDFFETIRRASHYYSYRTIVDLRPEIEAIAEPLIEEIFADIWAMSPDEPELVRAWCRSAEEPLARLQELNLDIFSIQEQRDVFLRDRDGQPLPFEDCSTGYYIIVPKHAAFHIGGPGSQSPVHRFNDQCPAAIKTTLDLLKKPEMIGLGSTAVHLAQGAGGEDKLCWCDDCFPRCADGGRLGWDYLERILGLSKDQLLLVLGHSEDLPILGLA